MSQVVFALFENRESWEKAQIELANEQILEPESKIIVHGSHTKDDELTFEESDLGNGLSKGFFLGLTLGFAIGFFGSWIVGYNMFGPWEYGILASVGFGLFGALGGVLAGSILPNPRLKELLDEMDEDQVVISTKVADTHEEGVLEERLRSLGALKVSHSFSIA
jgi:hypothetical protein